MSKKQAATKPTRSGPDHKARTLANKARRAEAEAKRQAEAAQYAAEQAEHKEALRKEREMQELAKLAHSEYERSCALRTKNQRWKAWLNTEVFHAPKYGFAPIPEWASVERDVRMAKEAARLWHLRRDVANVAFKNQPRFVQSVQSN
jgi:hypothetical protein